MPRNYEEGYIKNPHVFNLNQNANQPLNNNYNNNFHSLRNNAVKQQQNNFFLPPNLTNQNQSYLNPSTIQNKPTSFAISNVKNRLYPTSASE
jgi:hypothetical protein